MLNKMRQFLVCSHQPARPPGNREKASALAEGLREANPDCQPAIEVLLESDHDFTLLLNNIPAVVFKGYVDGSVDFFDQKIEALTGYPRKDFESRQRKWTDLVLEEDFEAVKQAFVLGLKTDKSYVREYRIRNR
ncbi:MAG: PAS domain-containing protein, partial [Deltaproteobacteria bacterium]|nr:PAS domain-containing protein [Deltaproteobacteria bacterium]